MWLKWSSLFNSPLIKEKQNINDIIFSFLKSEKLEHFNHLKNIYLNLHIVFIIKIVNKCYIKKNNCCIYAWGYMMEVVS